jgi:hypothetical protein
MVIGSANEGFEIWSLLPRVYKRSFPFAVYPVIAGEEGHRVGSCQADWNPLISSSANAGQSPVLEALRIKLPLSPQ